MSGRRRRVTAPNVRPGQRWRACEGIVPDLYIVEPAPDVDGWVVTSAGRDITILLTEDIVTQYVLVDVPGDI